MLNKIIKEALLEAAIEIDFLKNSIVALSKNSLELQISFISENGKDILGYIRAKSLNGSDCFSVKTVVADKGYGPLLYEFAMMSIYPSGVCPDNSGLSTSKAINVWNKFVERIDIEKLKVPPLALGAIRSNEEINKTMFRKPPSNSFTEFLAKSDDILESHAERLNVQVNSLKKEYFMDGAQKFKDDYNR